MYVCVFCLIFVHVIYPYSVHFSSMSKFSSSNMEKTDNSNKNNLKQYSLFCCIRFKPTPEIGYSSSLARNSLYYISVCSNVVCLFSIFKQNWSQKKKINNNNNINDSCNEEKKAKFIPLVKCYNRRCENV